MKPRTLLLSIALACFGLIGVAMYLQHVANLAPCPRCVIQRYAFLAVGIAALIGYFTNSIKIPGAVALLAAVGGLFAAGQHLYIIAHPSFGCGIDPVENFLNKLPTAHLMPFLFESYGACEHADMVLGMDIPQWSFLWFGLFTVALAWTLLRSRKT
ncbi:disulfide bond formation protein B [Pseudoduganella ginsengisoli]|uniref:Disulfide bond formation protein B n=1 Tax=Pseudoduganella ginsengisoli TaxID=1462440 RepID=A0A6L6PZT7_9BURK|nr:disulfide bond formation protein B [Pseudoduganella ginsengisoli]MTW02518.1 disulfide bond formation protein B [Pseudoduganella ginsengisoli]